MNDSWIQDYDYGMPSMLDYPNLLALDYPAIHSTEETYGIAVLFHSRHMQY